MVSRFITNAKAQKRKSSVACGFASNQDDWSVYDKAREVFVSETELGQVIVHISTP